MRSLSIEAKFSWGLELLGLKPIVKYHLDKLRNLFDYRNQFIHYKWRYHDADGDDKSNEDRKYENTLKDFDRILNYLRNYEKKNILLNVSISRILKK